MATEKQEIRRDFLLKDINLALPGLEIAPLFRPTALKGVHNVFYTDYTSAEDSREKHANYVHDPIVDIDYIWTPGIELSECVGRDKRFDWAIASHVLEHVPDPIGWLLEIFAVLNDEGVLSLALPDKRRCYDLFRRETEVSDLIDCWIRSQKIPSPLQVYDFLSRSVNDIGDGIVFRAGERFETSARTYSDQEALSFAMHTWKTGTYIDVHCSVFTASSFISLIGSLNDLGILNVEISKAEERSEEFFIKLKKQGEPRIPHPGKPDPHVGIENDAKVSALQADLRHARQAFEDALNVQQELKNTISTLECEPRFRPWVPRWLRRLTSK